MNLHDNITSDTHRLLSRQLKKSFPDGEWTEEGMIKLMQFIEASYRNTDEERKLIQRADRISSGEMQKMNEELRLKNEFLDSFNHGLAHAIKNHSSNLKGLVRILQKYCEKLKEEKILTVAEKLGNSVNQLNSILNGFLYLSRAEGLVDTQYSVIDSDRIKSEVDIEIEYLMLGRNVELEYRFELLDLYYSIQIIRIILVNLISNAIKFAKPGERGRVSVVVKNNAETLCLTVEDNGVGMDLENPNNRVFSLFNRRNAQAEISGFGIGLYMVKKVIERNNGQIKFESELGHGTKINVEFPLI
jgi:signal transduction histidine kinase